MGDYDVPLVDLGLVPSAVMTFAWHPEVAEEVSQQVRQCIQGSAKRLWPGCVISAGKLRHKW